LTFADASGSRGEILTIMQVAQSNFEFQSVSGNGSGTGSTVLA
jgi:hypothetical protein